MYKSGRGKVEAQKQNKKCKQEASKEKNGQLHG